MRTIVTLSGIDEAILNLGYINEKHVKTKVIRALRQFYTDENSVRAITKINPDDLIRIIWDTDASIEAIRNKRKNFSSIKSTINAELTRLHSEGKNPEGVIIGRNNTFDMSDVAKSELLKNFADSGDDSSPIPLAKINDILGIINDILKKDKSQSGIDPSEDKNSFNQLKELIQSLSQMIGSDASGGDIEVVYEDAPQEDIELEEVEDMEEADEDLEEAEVVEVPEDQLEEVEDLQEIEELDDADNDIEEVEAGEDLEETEVEEVPEDQLEEVEDIQEVEELDDADADIEEVGANEDLEEAEVEEVPEDQLEEVEDLQEIEELDDADNDIEEVEAGEDLEETEVEEVPEDQLEEVEDIQEVEELDDADADIEEVGANEDLEEAEVEEVPEDQLEEVEDIQEIEELDDADADIEEVGANEDLEEAEVEEVPEDQLEEVEDLQEIEELDDADNDIEEVEAGEDLEETEVEEVPEDQLEEVEDLQEVEELNDADADIEDVDELPPEEIKGDVEIIEADDALEDLDVEEFPEEELEEVEDIEEHEEVEEIPEDELEEVEGLEDAEVDHINNERLLADEFSNMLSEMDRYYNQYILIPKGAYLSGGKDTKKNGKPAGKVDIKEFYFGKFPVTNALFEIFIEKTGYITTAEKLGHSTVYYGRYQNIVDNKTGLKTLIWNSALETKVVEGACWYQPAGPGSTLYNKRNHPVVQVSLEDAMAFAGWTGKRIPAEDQWEAAARTLKGYKYPWGKEYKAGSCNTEDSYIGDTTQVDKYPEGGNSLGIMDILGNVMEWTIDNHQIPAGHKHGLLYIVKGGSWISGNDISLYDRFFSESNATSNILGFRCIAY